MVAANEPGTSEQCCEFSQNRYHAQTRVRRVHFDREPFAIAFIDQIAGAKPPTVVEAIIHGIDRSGQVEPIRGVQPAAQTQRHETTLTSRDIRAQRAGVPSF